MIEKSRGPLAGAVVFALLAGCQSPNPYANQPQGQPSSNNTAKGAGIGAVAGAVLGAAVSGNHDRGRGALTGAAVGAAIGGGVGYHMDKQEKQLRERLANSGVDVQRQGDTLKLVVPSAISFDTGSARLRPEFEAPLDQVAASLNQFPDTHIQVVGHTDSTGGIALNQQLSVNRANAVALYLGERGVAPARMQTAGMGPSQPIASNDTAAGRAQNRRVEIKIIADQAEPPMADHGAGTPLPPPRGAGVPPDYRPER